jgi:hypothetical protein
MGGRRIQDWLVGRHEFRGLAVVDPAVARAHGGRPIPGTRRAEFVQVATGRLDQARQDAANALYVRLAAEIPDARLEALLDGGPPAEPGPGLRLVDGGRPRLALIGPDDADDPQEPQRRVDRVVRLWGLPQGRYVAPGALDPDQQARRRVLLALGVPFGLPLVVLLAVRWLGAIGPDGWPPLPLLFADIDPLLLGVVFGLPLLPAVAGISIGWYRSWPIRERCLPFVAALAPSVAVLMGVGVVNGADWLIRSIPGIGMVAMAAILIASLPLFVLSIGAARWWAALGWGLPLVAGGIAAFVGDVLYELYLGAFGLGRTDVQISFWSQWAWGASTVAIALLGIYLGVAWGVVGRRLGVNLWLVALFVVPFTALIVAIVADATLDNVQRRAQVDASGLPSPLFALQPRLACVVPVAGAYSYVGQPVAPTSGPVVYFGRADGRLAVWSAQSGGVLLDGQGVALRFVQPGSTCS